MNINRIISIAIATVMTLQTVVFANEETFTSFVENSNENNKEKVSIVVPLKDKTGSSKKPNFDNELTGNNATTIPVRTLRKRIDPKTDKYEMEKPGDDEVRVITTYKNSPDDGNGRKLGGKHKAMNVSRSNLDIMLASDNIAMVENDHLVYRTSTDIVNGESNMDLSVMIGNFYPSSFDSLAVEEYHKKGVFGKDIKVAIFDTGLNTKSTELNIVGGATFVDGSNSFADDNGHGTSMAGIIGAAMDNEGITGIAPNAELYSVKVLDSNGVGYTSSVIEGIYWAVENDIDIICFGFATDEYSNALADAVGYAKNNGIFMIAPAGNDGESAVMYPAGYDEVVSVGSVNNEGTISSFSNRGSTIDFYAPGESVDSIVYVNNKPTPFSGTSASAAHAVGFAVLLLEENKDNQEFDVFEFFTSENAETKLGFVENMGSKVAVMSVDNMGTPNLQKSANEITEISTLDSSVMSSRATNTTLIGFGEKVTGELTSFNRQHNYFFNTDYSSQVISFTLTGVNCKVYYEDEYSGINIDVTNQSLVLQKGKHNIHIAYDYAEDFTETNYTLTITLGNYVPFENKNKSQNGVYEPSGEFGYTFDDFITVVGGKEFRIQRQFNSSNNNISNHFNKGWTFNFEKKAELHCKEIVYNDEIKYKYYLSVPLPDGSILHFEEHTGADGSIKYLPINSRASISENYELTDSVVVTTPDQTEYYYYPVTGRYPDKTSIGYLYQIIDRYGNSTNITIDDGKIQEIADYSNNRYTFNYDTDDKLISLSDSNGRVVTYTYNGKKLIQSTDAAGITHYYSYDEFGLLNEIKNARDGVIAAVTYEVDYDYEDIDVFKADTITDKYGTTYKYEYDTINETTIVREVPEVEEDGTSYRERSSTYDAEKDIIYCKDELGRQASIEYFYHQEGAVSEDSDGNLCFVVDADYRKWKNGEILRQVDYTGLITEYGFFTFGNGLAESKTVTNSTGTILEYEEYEYNSNGDVTLLESWISKPDTASERTRKATRFEYDGTKLVKKAEYLPVLVENASVPELNDTNLCEFAITSYEYDNDNAIKGLVSKVTYPAQYTGAATDKGWVYEYDGNQISVTNPESTEANVIKDVYEYNALGLVSKHTSGEGVITEYEYNNNLQETKKTVTIENGTEVTFTEYNELGLPVQIVSPNEYNAAYEEDDGTYSDGTVGIRYTYNDNGTLASETDNEGNCIEYEYDRFGNIQTKKMPNGVMYKYSYDDISNVTKEYYRWNNKNYTIHNYEYKYANGNTSHKIEEFNDNSDCTKDYITVYNHFGKEVEYRDLYENGLEQYKLLFYDLQGNLVNEYYIDQDSLKCKGTYYTNDNFDASAITTYDEKFTSSDVVPAISAERTFGVPDDTTYKYERTDYDKNGNVVRTLVSTVAEENVPTLADVNVVTEVSEYYADNLLKSKTDVYGVKTEYEYDKDRNLSKVTVTEPGKTPQIIAYTNSHNGKPKTIKTYVDDENVTDSDNLRADSLGTYTLTTNTYDKNGNLTRQDSSTGLITEYSYDKNNLQISMTSYEASNKNQTSQSKIFEYDFRGNVIKQVDINGPVPELLDETDEDVSVTRFVYNEFGYLIYTIHPNGKITLTTRDKYGKLVAEVDAIDYNGAATAEIATLDTYEIYEIYETDKTNIFTMNRTEYTYDQFDRVVKVTRHTYDPETETTTSVDRQTNTYDIFGNLIATTDANGNTIGYEYDAFGNCTKYIEPAKYGISNRYTTFYEYDMLGRKIKEGNANGD